MRKLTTAEVARMTTTQGESFNDAVTLYHFTTGQDSLGQVQDSFDTGNLVTCGLLTAKQYKSERGEVITIDADAILRVALTQTIHVGDKVIGRGTTYLVDGVQVGRNVQIVPLKEIKI
jgi:hypothetical protein